MALQVDCPGCGHRLMVSVALAGRIGKCPKCGGSVQVPAAQPATVPEKVAGEDDAYSIGSRESSAVGNSASEEADAYAVPSAVEGNEDQPVQSPVGSARRRPKGLKGQKLEIKVRPPKAWDGDDPRHASICQVLHDEITKYLVAGEKDFWDVKLDVHVSRFETDQFREGFQIQAAIDLKGTINGCSVNEIIVRDHGVRTRAPGSRKGIHGFDRLLARRAEFGVREEMFVELLEKLDATIARRPSRHAKRWGLVKILAAVIYVLSIPVSVWILSTHRISDSTAARVMLSSMINIPLIGVVLASGIMLMPGHFFRSDSEGRKLVQFSGLTSPRYVKVVSVFLGLVFAGAMFGFWYIQFLR